MKKMWSLVWARDERANKFFYEKKTNFPAISHFASLLHSTHMNLWMVSLAQIGPQAYRTLNDKGNFLLARAKWKRKQKDNSANQGPHPPPTKQLSLSQKGGHSIQETALHKDRNRLPVCFPHGLFLTINSIWSKQCISKLKVVERLYNFSV